MARSSPSMSLRSRRSMTIPQRGTGSKIINSIKEGLPDARLVIGVKLLDALARGKGA